MTKTKKKPSGIYTAEIKVQGRTYQATGTTVAEAISSLKPTNCKGKGILTISHGETKKERILMPVVTFRLFNTMGLTKEIAVKQASLLFQGI